MNSDVLRAESWTLTSRAAQESYFAVISLGGGGGSESKALDLRTLLQPLWKLPKLVRVMAKLIKSFRCYYAPAAVLRANTREIRTQSLHCRLKNLESDSAIRSQESKVRMRRQNSGERTACASGCNLRFKNFIFYTSAK